MEDCRNCPHEAEIEALKRDMDRNSSTHREFYNMFNELKIDAQVQKSSFENILSVVNEIKADVKELKEKPSKRWDTVVVGFISGASGIIATVFFSGLIK